MKILSNLVPLAVIGVLFISCSKDHSLTSRGTRIMKVVFTGDSVATYTFQYDSKNRLTSIVAGLDSFPEVDRILISYGADGKLSSCSFQGGKAIFYYSSTGQIVRRVVAFDSDNRDTIKNFYDYDAGGRLINDSSFWVGQTRSLRIRFNYDSNGNITMVENLTHYTGSLQTITLEEYEYDNKPNPYQTIGLTGYFIKGESVFLSKNTRVHQKWQNNLGMTVTLDGKFEYYGNGFPSKTNYTYTPVGYLNLKKVEYFYE
jgi:hypothetical protein